MAEKGKHGLEIALKQSLSASKKLRKRPYQLKLFTKNPYYGNLPQVSSDDNNAMVTIYGDV